MVYTGTKSTGIKLPIIKKGDNLVNIVVNSIEAAVENNEISELHNRDVIGLTESIVARAQGNYVTTDDIADDIDELYFHDFDGKKELAVVFPIMSRNRFSVILSGIAKACDKVTVFLKAPCDEVGNVLINDWDWLDVNQVVSDEYIYSHYDYKPHAFTGIDYMKLYRDIIELENCEAQILVSPYPERVVDYCRNILCADIHTREKTKEKIEKEFCKYDKHNYTVLTLSDICTTHVGNSGYNSVYGLLGSNKMSDNMLKLFPRNCFDYCYDIQKLIKNRFNVDVEVMVYGDGAFKDPVGEIWEFAEFGNLLTLLYPQVIHLVLKERPMN